MFQTDIQASVPADAPHWIEPGCKSFVEVVAQQGYAREAIRVYGVVARGVCAAIRARGLDAAAIDLAVVADICGRPAERSGAHVQSLWKGIAERFFGHLSESGVIDLSVPNVLPEVGSLEHLWTEYDGWLRHQRGLRSSTILEYRRIFAHFMRFRFGDDPICPDQITAGDIMAFLSPKGGENRAHPQSCVSSRLRILLRFLHATGRTPENLAMSVAPNKARRRSAPQPDLSPDELRRLLESVRGDTTLARRDYAILLLAARLGLRRKEVVSIRLDDINWRQDEILIRGKGNLHDAMPLPTDVGEALADYIRHGRKGTARHLFVTVNAPWRPLLEATIVTRIFRGAVRRRG